MDDDQWLLSFTDALTCVLGASIVLFLIFVSMVKLTPATDGAGAPISEGRSRAPSVDLVSGAFSAALEISSADCRFVQDLGPKDDRRWDMIDEGTGACGVLFLFESVSATSVEVGTVRRPPPTVEVVLEIGPYRWPERESAQVTFPLEEPRCALAGGAVLRMRIGRDGAPEVVGSRRCT